MNETLLEVLVCPVTRTALRWDAAAKEMVSEAAGLAYPVRDGVPVMLVEQARLLDPPLEGEGDHPKDGGGVSAAENDLGG